MPQPIRSDNHSSPAAFGIIIAGEGEVRCVHEPRLLCRTTGTGHEMTSLLSVVIPTHNRSVQLERAARSVLDQDGVEVQLVIVDDASSDDTPEVTDRLAVDRRVQVVRNDRSVGPGAARNKGIAATDGDLLGFCDDDDAWLPGAAGALSGYLDDHADLGVVTSWHRVVHDRTGRKVEYRGPQVFGADDLLWFNVVALPFGIIRRAAYADDLSFDERLPPCEDWDLWVRCAQQRPIAAVPQVLYEYHQHGGERVTKEGSGDRGGLRAFVDKHRSEMSPACRIFHRASLAHQARGRAAMARELASSGRSEPVASAFAAAVLTTADAAASMGIRRGDPGLQSRTMLRLLAHQPGMSHAGGGGR
jgi:Glycosyl transferase family 2